MWSSGTGVIFLCSETEQRENPLLERSLYVPGPPDRSRLVCVCVHTRCQLLFIYVWLTCQAFRALSFGQKLKELASHGMWLQLLRTSGLAFSGLTAAVSWGFIGTLRFKDIDGMLVFRVIMVLPSLGHHLPIGLLEISSLLPPSRDIQFLTLGLALGWAPEKRLERCTCCNVHKATQLPQASIPKRRRGRLPRKPRSWE